MRIRRSDEGMTIIELSVVLLLLGIVSVILFGFLDNTTTTAGRADRDVAAELNAQTVLRQVSQNLRAANPILASCGSGYGSCLSFKVARPGIGGNSNLNCTSTYTYQVQSGTFTETRTDANCGASPSNAVSRSYTNRPLIAIQNTAVFSYFDRVGKPISVTAACSPDPAQPACPQQAKTVTITLVVKYQNNVVPITFSSTASLRNNR